MNEERRICVRCGKRVKFKNFVYSAFCRACWKHFKERELEDRYKIVKKEGKK